jgi:anaerobic dimethyl sulfoxide reductase subunit A
MRRPSSRPARSAYEPYPTDDQLTTVVTSCAHNCGSRHMLVAHKKGDVIVRLSTDDGRYQEGGAFGFDTEQEPQLRACLRGRSYRSRIYSPERLLYPMLRVGERGEGKFKRVSWDEALDFIAKKMVELKSKYGPTALLDQAYAGASYGVLHKSDQIEGLLGRFLGMFGCRTNSWSVPSYQGTTFSSRMDLRHHRGRQRGRRLRPLQADHHVGLEPGLHLPRRQHLLLHAPGQAARLQVRAGRSAIHRFGRGYDAWWIPIKPNTDAAMLAGMAHHIFSQQPAGSGLHRQVRAGHGRRHDARLGARARRTSRTTSSASRTACRRRRSGPRRSAG